MIMIIIVESKYIDIANSCVMICLIIMTEKNDSFNVL